MITIAALAAVLAVALIAASSARAQSGCTLTGSSLTGTTGPDLMCGTEFPDTMNGGSGNDELRGQGDDDVLRGEGGNDTLKGSSGIDLLDGGSGNDVLIGGTDGNLLFGDRFIGGSGNDRLEARDGVADDLSKSTCGAGTDSLDLDLFDLLDIVTFGGVLGLPIYSALTGCELINVGAVNEGPNVKISRRSVDVGEDGRAAVRLRCPASLTAPCAGKLRIGRTKNSQGAPKAYSINKGKKENVSARLSQRDRNKLSQRGRITAGLISVEQGQHGDKTTVQTIKLIAQG